VRKIVPDPVILNRFEVALWVFSLYLPSLGFRGILNSFHENPTALACKAVGFQLL
jgi:hypothetical protein